MDRLEYMESRIKKIEAYIGGESDIHRYEFTRWFLGRSEAVRSAIKAFPPNRKYLMDGKCWVTREGYNDPVGTDPFGNEIVTCVVKKVGEMKWWNHIGLFKPADNYIVRRVELDRLK